MVLNGADMDGVVVIEKGERDEVPVLFGSESLAICCNASCLSRFCHFLTSYTICAIIGGPVRCQWSSLRSAALDVFPVSLKLPDVWPV